MNNQVKIGRIDGTTEYSSQVLAVIRSVNVGADTGGGGADTLLGDPDGGAG